MKLILSDCPLSIQLPPDGSVVHIDLSQLRIANCVGCFGCWTKTPGRCVIRDDATQVYPLIARSERLVYVSRIRYGSYDTVMKTMLERAIPIQQAFIRSHHGETHHYQRAVAPKQALIVAYGDTGAEEQALFRQLVARNAHNMNFEHYEIVFSTPSDLDGVVSEEVAKWQSC